MTSTAVFTVQLFVALTSVILSFFYLFQKVVNKNCNFHPLFVQMVTAVVYSCSAFGFGDFVWVNALWEGSYSANSDGIIEITQDDIHPIAVGRYLFWIMTCPVILHGYIGLLHELGTAQDYNTTILMIVKDIGLMTLGALAAFQTPGPFKAFLIVFSFVVAIFLVYQLIMTFIGRLEYFPSHMHKFLYGSITLFMCSWTIFPVLYVLGEPAFGLTSLDTDVICHAIGDFLAKNTFGFVVWYFRFNVVYPYKRELEGEGNGNAVVPFKGSSTVPTLKDRKASDPEEDDEEQANVASSGRNVLIIDNSAAYQRLLMFMMKSAGVESTLVFSLEQARAVITRGRVDEFDAILINVPEFMNQPEALSTFKTMFSEEPYFVPILGYSFDPECGSMMEEEQMEQRFTHGFIVHSLDERQILSAVREWKHHADFWRETAKKRSKEIQRLNSMRRQSGYAPGSPTSPPALSTSPRSNLYQRRQHSSSFDGGDLYGSPTNQGAMRRRPSSFDQGHDLLGDMPQSLNRGDSFMTQSNPRPYERTDSFMQKPTLDRSQSFLDRQMNAMPAPVQAPQQPREQSGSFDHDVHHIQRQSSVPAPAPRSPQQQADAERCGNRSCDNFGEMVCGNCGKAYCSQRCQLVDWKAGHKAECKILSQQR